jgi:uncharacterized membrane protein YraQ (UPF0718 family)
MKNISSNNKKLLIIALVTGVIACFFWTGSRYPQLSEKALLGTDVPSMGISFDTVRDIQEHDSRLTQIFTHTLNWLETNKKGMSFGILFGSALMLLFSILREKKSENRWVNTFLGVVIGAPLGVCVNCAAPIAKGMKDAGAKTETALATMVSSPTLNVIVLSMLFSLLPPYMIWLKLGSTFVLLLLVIPMLSKIFQARDRKYVPKNKKGLPSFLKAPEIQTGDSGENSSWLTSAFWVVKEYIKSLWFLIRTTVPLMLLAGFLGNVMITYLPLDGLAAYTQSASSIEIVGYMVGLAFLGTFLPVPMSFDVLITAILWSAGLPAKYSMVLLFTLGSFSIYSTFVIDKGFSRALALSMFAIVAGMGLVNGTVGHFLEKKLSLDSQLAHYEMLRDSGQPPSHYLVQARDSTVLTSAEIDELKDLKTQDASFWENPSLMVSQISFNPKGSTAQKWFNPINGPSIGLDVPYDFTPMMVHEPFGNQRSMATGDVHNDGYPDVLVSSANTLFLFANLQGKSFKRQALEVPNELKVFNAALVDLDNDRWPDIYFSTYLGGNYIMMNHGGSFQNSEPIRLPSPENMVVSSSAAFGDINHDGFLDIVIGNWSLGSLGGTRYSIENSHNFWLKNNGDLTFEIEMLTASAGETLSTLLTDFTGDAASDLWVGNDFFIPDYLYEGKMEEGGLELISDPKQVVQRTTHTTMSVTSADINNDLQLEIYEAQVDRGNKKFRTLEISNICGDINDPEQRKYCEAIFTKQKDYVQATMKQSFKDIPENELIDAIAAQLVRNQKQMGAAFEACRYLPIGWDEFSFICNFKVDETRNYHRFLENSQDVKKEGGVLLEKNASGKYMDKAKELGITTTGWAWNSKFADLDNDEWQDLLVANGYLVKPIQETNIFYHNLKGEKFEDLTFTTGLRNYLPTSSYSYVDYDLDGDLDIIAATSVGPVTVYENNNHGNHSIAFELRDTVGNPYGIGAKIIIEYGDGKHQIREIILGGGYKSFDAPIAYFGLGEHNQVKSVIVKWPNGEKDEINTSFDVDNRYIITRKK